MRVVDAVPRRAHDEFSGRSAFEDDARRVARRTAVMAGFRKAGRLKRLFAAD
jgi:hypothetical protein